MNLSSVSKTIVLQFYGNLEAIFNDQSLHFDLEKNTKDIITNFALTPIYLNGNLLLFFKLQPF